MGGIWGEGRGKNHNGKSSNMEGGGGYGANPGLCLVRLLGARAHTPSPHPPPSVTYIAPTLFLGLYTISWRMVAIVFPVSFLQHWPPGGCPMTTFQKALELIRKHASWVTTKKLWLGAHYPSQHAQRKGHSVS